VLAILSTELRRRIADRSIIVSSLVAPAVIAAIIGFAFGASGTVNRIDIGIALDHPTAEATAVVKAGIAAAGFGSIVHIEAIATPAELKSEVSGGRFGAGVIVPEGFAQAASFGLPTRDVQKAKTDIAMPGLLADVTIGPGNGPPGARLTVVAGSTSSLQGQVAEALAAAISSRLYAGALLATATPPTTPTTEEALDALTATAHSEASTPISFKLTEIDIGNNHAVIGYYGSSLAVVFLFIGAGLGTRAIAMERTGGTLTRLAVAPISSTWIVIGKMLAVLITAITGLLVLWAETVLLFGATWGSVTGVLIMCFVASLSMCSLAMFLTSLAKDEQQAYAASIIVGIILGIVGGNFFPPGALPGPLQFVSLLTPNGWALVGFGRLALTNAGISGLKSPLIVLGCISAVLVAASAFRIRRVVEL
jgi:ABC-2 type transport system permease protein